MASMMDTYRAKVIHKRKAKMTKTIFVVQAYEYEREGKLIDSCILEVYAKTEDEAVKKAKAYIKKKNYRINQVIEK